MDNLALIRPRLNDYYGLPFTQEEVDFVIPYLDEDVPLYLDPFLLWKSPSQQDNSLHTAITNSFNNLGYLYSRGKEAEAVRMLIKASECFEVGLGDSKKRKGVPIGQTTAKAILSLYKAIPQINKAGFTHFEEIQLYIDQVSKDRISDFACNFIKSFLIDFTIDQSSKHGIPCFSSTIDVYDYRKNTFGKETKDLPQNPENKSPILLVPKRWLRFIPWINYDDYTKSYFEQSILKANDPQLGRISILTFNRNNYDLVQAYLILKESAYAYCKNDPLFKPLPVYSVRRKLSTILALPTGKTDKADRIYEDDVSQLLTSVLHPQLDFADMQSRTESGALIRDIIFYSNRSDNFLKEIYDNYDCRQIVIEIKNVKEIEPDNINQLSRYLSEQFGRFGIIATRHPISKKVHRNVLDLWAGHRKCIIFLTDADIEMMCQLYASRQRLPIDVVKKKYIEFTRECPS